MRSLTAFILGVTLSAPHVAIAQQCCPSEQCHGDLDCDNRVKLEELVAAVSSAVRGCPASATPTASPTPKPTVTPGGDQRFPPTGQTTCWDVAGNVIDCGGTGQDGEVAAGGPVAYVDNGDGTITDLNTHLMWEKKGADGGLHDWFKSYEWINAFSFIAELNADEGFAGYTDWRLPNVKELQSIVSYQDVGPTVNRAFHDNCTPGCASTGCSCTNIFQYATATTHVPNPSFAWSIYFTNGYVLDNSKTHSEFNVRGVRDGGPRFPATGQTACWDAFGGATACDGTGQDGDFQAGGALAYADNGDGTITDTATGLMWEKKSADGGIHDWADTYAWADALGTFIDELNAGDGFAGHTDWRLPNVKELQSIVNLQNFEPAVSPAFDDCAPGCDVATCSCTRKFHYWSSTTNASSPRAAWSVYFTNGYVLNNLKPSRFHVRAVRGGS